MTTQGKIIRRGKCTRVSALFGLREGLAKRRVLTVEVKTLPRKGGKTPAMKL